MVDHMGWRLLFAKRVTRWAVQKNFILRHGNALNLTSLGREMARQVMLTGK